MALDNIQGAELIQVMSLTSGIIRPSGDSIRNDYLTGKKYDNGHPAINELFKNNSGYCVDENTKISTSNGYKKIKDINVGDMVNTLDGYRKVNMIFNNGEKECYELITKCGYKLTCTSDHKIMTSSGYKKVKDLDADLDSIVISLNDCTEAQHTSIRYARILGMLCGDGMLTQRRIIKFISNNIKQAQEFKHLVSSEFEDCDVVIREDFYEEKNNLFICTVVNKVKFSNNIKSMIKELIIDGYKSLNGGCGALDKFIPKRIMNSNRDVKLSFISGLLDTDGSITARGHVRFKTASDKLAHDIQDILRSIGYMSNIYKAHEKSYDITVRNGSYLHLELIGLSNKANNIEYKEKNKRGLKIVSSKFINENLPKSYSKEKYPDMKKNTLTSLFLSKNQLSLDRISGYSIEKELKIETQYLLNKECCFDRIDSISLVGNKKVYDIEVDDNHSYFANGIVVHNCTYQEDIMLFLKEFCGYSDHEADTVRRGIAKKIGTEHLIDEIERRFIGYFSKNYNESEDKCKELIQGFLKIVDNASSYSFSYNHSLPYSMTGYICGYLRCYYPKEYYTAMLNEFNDKPEKMKEIYTHIYQHSNFSIESPVFRKATMEYSYDKEKDIIYEGLAGLKGVSKNIESALNELPIDIDNYLDLLIYIKENKLKASKKDLNTLIK
ncbi:MAG: LAGLIDADG family homing endonuclease, partial [Paraclostridium sp.]